MADNKYSKLVSVELHNFMSIKHCLVEFGDRGILNIKGYNDSGKSAILRALEVLFFNIRPRDHQKFILSYGEGEAENFFRITVKFDDGVVIKRERYLDGGNLYEMKQNGKLLYTNMDNGVLGKITAVPLAIKKYLRLISIETTGWNINTARCFDSRLLCETNPSDNYKALSEIMMLEELSQGGVMLNTDKNKLGNELEARKIEVQIYEKDVDALPDLSEEFITALKHSDDNLCDLETRFVEIDTLSDKVSEYENCKITPEMPILDTEQLNLLSNLKETQEKIDSIKILPHFENIETEQIELLYNLKSVENKLNAINILPQIEIIDMSRLEFLLDLKAKLKDLQALQEQIKNAEIESEKLHKEIHKLAKQLGTEGVDYKMCNKCGNFMSLKD
ncbi:MAG: AAA family ATPase [Oscillospiraceae bacterium]|nr:AAA family ATPase [Oscillospiraceae bacterium]